MPRYVALLRAINVGGRRVKMDHLRELFGALGFANVESFIASGNVIFDSDEDTRTLERKIEDYLWESLGYEVATFVRTASELENISRYRPFDPSDSEAEGNLLYIAFLHDTPSAEEKLMTYRTEVDDFRVHAREVYWLCRKRMGEPPFSGATLERVLGTPATIRNSTTVRRLSEKYPASQ